MIINIIIVTGVEEGCNNIIAYIYIMQAVSYWASFPETFEIHVLPVLPAYCNLPVHLLELATYLISQ